jgi:hypothetical protein
MTRSKRATSTRINENAVLRKKNRIRQQTSITNWLSNLQIKNESDDITASAIENLSIGNKDSSISVKEEQIEKMEEIVEQQAYTDEASSESNDDDNIKSDTNISNALDEQEGMLNFIIYFDISANIYICILYRASS